MFIIKVGSKEMIRDINNKIVLEAIIEKMPISRAELSKELGLTKATISSIVQDLINNSFVIEIGSGDTAIGRKPTMLTMNPNVGMSLCFNLCVDKVDFMITNIIGEKLYENTKYFKEENIITIIKELIDIALPNMTKTIYGIIGITLGIHGVINNNEIVFTPYYSLPFNELEKALSKYYDTPVFLFNESNLAVLGENLFCSKVENIACIEIHSGIGLGMVLNNNLYTGFNGYAGEFGHTIIEIDGRQCPCGNNGCLEQYASERAVLKDLAHIKNVAKITFEEYSQLYRQSDKETVLITNRFVSMIAAGINNILNLYNPEIIILNSQFTKEFPDLLDEIKSLLKSNTNFAKNIHLSKLNDDAILYGAAYINILNFLEINNFSPKMNNLYF